MVLDRWFLRQFFDGFLQEVHGQKIGVLLVVDPAEGVGDVRIVRLLLTCGLGIGERGIEVAPCSTRIQARLLAAGATED